jgi:hypothetical protein
LSLLAMILIAVGAVLLGIGVKIARWPISDRYLGSVVAAIEADSGSTPPSEAVRRSIRRDRRRAGTVIGTLGAALIAAALGTM